MLSRISATSLRIISRAPWDQLTISTNRLGASKASPVCRDSLPCKVVGLVDIRQILGNLQSAVQRMEMRAWLKYLGIQVRGPAVQIYLYLFPERMK